MCELRDAIMQDPDALEAAFLRFQQVADNTAPGDPELAERLYTLAEFHALKYKISKDQQHLDATILKCQQIVDLHPPNRVAHLHNLIKYLRKRVAVLNEQADMELVLDAYLELLKVDPKDDSSRSNYLPFLSQSLCDRFRRFGDLRHLDALIQCDQEILDSQLKMHPLRQYTLSSLAVSLLERFKRFGDPSDLGAALGYQHEALEMTPKGHPWRAGSLNNIATNYLFKFRRLHDLESLHAAVEYSKEAADLTPPGDRMRARHVHTLGCCLGDRFSLLGDPADLKASRECLKEALDLTPVDSVPHRASYAHAVAASRTKTFLRFGDLRDLSVGIEHHQEAVDLLPGGHIDRVTYLQGLFVSLQERYRRLGNPADLAAAHRASEAALANAPPGHAARPACLYRFAASLVSRFQLYADPADLEAALGYQQEALSIIPPDHSDRAAILQGLASFLTKRYLISKHDVDLAEIRELYTASFKIVSHPDITWNAALSWASFAEDHSPRDAPDAYAAAFSVLPSLVWVGHSIPTRQTLNIWHGLEFATASAVRACISTQNLTLAVQFLEQGVATTFSQMMQLKTDVSAVPEELAREFERLSGLLYTREEQSLDSEEGSMKMDVVLERTKVIQAIRGLPGLERFLLPREYSELALASRYGPIVILNAHPNQCDAIVILDPVREPRHVPLPGVTQSELKAHKKVLDGLLARCNSRARDSASTRLFGKFEIAAGPKSVQERFQNLLSWLWTQVVGPVFDVLAANGITEGRMWWCPTGAFTALPLHAAAPSDDYIQSYTSTLGALLESHSKLASLNHSVNLCVVGVTDRQSNSLSSLPGVKLELSKIQALTSRKCASYTELLGPQATVSSVATQLKQSSWMHLASHGTQDLLNPSQSCFHLYDGPLPLSTILSLCLPKSAAHFAFLAACQTAMGDSALANESFHLGGGLIAAGFCATVGTMWSMCDEDGPVVAEGVYGYLFSEERTEGPRVRDTAKALQLAPVQGLRPVFPFIPRKIAVLIDNSAQHRIEICVLHPERQHFWRPEAFRKLDQMQLHPTTTPLRTLPLKPRLQILLSRHSRYSFPSPELHAGRSIDPRIVEMDNRLELGVFDCMSE
ncbi:CHAT domain-containing protein [Roridomyces roridus]|uniref:CHAT domain-containing protein n=1 Tax=Roridomyces roridus TaxID=1738132 RepID=A0AAD7BB19_9AGAR|nr:CHAT domain-containing protein [Roridomyces roridus]